MADLAISNGILLVAKLNNEINGIAIVYKRDESVIINELLVETKDAEHSLLFHLKQHTGCNRMIQLLPPDKKQPQQALGMARIIDARAVLQLYAAGCPEVEMNIELTDEQLSVNNGYYYLCKGKCMTSEVRLPGVHTRMTIAELSEKILDEMQPYMSLMMN